MTILLVFPLIVTIALSCLKMNVNWSRCMICQEITQENLVNKIVLDSLERLCHDDQADENCKWLQNETPASLELAGNVKTFGVCVGGGGHIHHKIPHSRDGEKSFPRRERV